MIIIKNLNSYTKYAQPQGWAFFIWLTSMYIFLKQRSCLTRIVEKHGECEE